MATPVLARRSGRPLQPAWGSGAVLLASLVLLAFVSLGPISAAALWALALLLAIMNAGLFVESASGGLPRISQVGSLLSWVLLGMWWLRAAGSVGVLPSLMVMTGLTLITLAGHAWAGRAAPATTPRRRHAPASRRASTWRWSGHVFLILIAANREWSLPPWPLFGALAVDDARRPARRRSSRARRRCTPPAWSARRWWSRPGPAPPARRRGA